MSINEDHPSEFNSEQGFKEKSDLINSKIDAKLNENTNKYPKAIYFIIPNELCERFCYFGITALKFKFLMMAYGLTAEKAKIFTHLFIGLNYFAPVIGATISDSYLGKYRTIVIFSSLYLLSNILISVFSINGLIGEYGNYPIYSFLLPALLFSLGTGGIKSCAISHGGDQFLPSQSRLRANFFSIFYASIYIGGIVAVFSTPYIRAYVNCFGSPCYPLAFGIPSIAFSIALILFIYGHRYYRVVPPQGEFLLWKSVKIIFLAIKRSFKSSLAERKTKHHWLHRAQPEYNFDFIEETRLMSKVTVVLIPIVFYYSLFSQFTTEWQKHYEKMNKMYFGLFYVPTEASLNIKMILVIILVPFLNYIVYPFFRKKGYNLTLINRMIFGYFLVITAFIIAVFLDSYIEQYADTIIIENNSVISCTGCLNGGWQFPQFFLLALGEAFFGPSALQFAYDEVGPQLKAIASSIYLLTPAFGNCVIMILEHPLHAFISQTRQWIHIVISTLWFFIFIYITKRWFVSKEEEESKNLE